MYIEKIIIENFKCFGEKFTLLLNKNLNILVGDNESGKSTILEAIHLALSGWINGKYIRTELNQSLFNSLSIEKYLDKINSNNPLPPPNILIELFINFEDDAINALFEGEYNSLKNPKASGLQFKIFFDQDHYQDEYNILINSEKEVKSLPIEFYDISWTSFSREEGIIPKKIPLKTAFIDSSNSRLQSGSDVYISQILKDKLSDENKIQISQAHRRLRDSFSNEEIIAKINQELQQNEISNKKIELSVEMATKNAWENSIVTYLDKIPFSNIGKGEQCLIKTKLALSHKKNKEANLLLIEEPENHLSHVKLNKLISFIKNENENKQIIISTHNSFVANKLGLGSLLLLKFNEIDNKRNIITLNNLKDDTKNFFEKLAGFDTLRLILCKKAILVEGPSDELIIQKAYMVKNNGKLPVEDEIDVISVGTSFLRFLEIADQLNQQVVVVTDNDGNYRDKIEKKYEEYLNKSFIKIIADNRIELPTLEPQLVEANKGQLDKLREILNINLQKYPDGGSVIEYMKNNFYDYSTYFHPNLIDFHFFNKIRLIDYKQTIANQYYYTFDYFEGISVFKYCKGKHLDLILDLVAELCAAVKFLHLRGFLLSSIDMNDLQVINNGNKYCLKILSLPYPKKTNRKTIINSKSA